MSSETSIIPEPLAPFFTVEAVVVYPMTTLCVMYCIYGFYILLFGICLHVLRSKSPSSTRSPSPDGLDQPNRRLYLSLSIALFVLCTLFVIFQTLGWVRDPILRWKTVTTGDYKSFLGYLRRDLEKTLVYSFQFVIPVLLNATAEWMLIHRCYLIWSSSKRVAIPLIIASVLVNAFGFAGSIVLAVGFSNTGNETNFELYNYGGILNFAYSVSSAVLNSVITLLTAGRIWIIHREVVAHGIHASDSFVQSIIRIILESGIIYPTLIIISLIVPNTTASPFDFGGPAALAAGIAPTLIIVRAKLGKNNEAGQTPSQMISDIHFDSRPAPRGGAHSISIVGLDRDVESGSRSGSEDQVNLGAHKEGGNV